MTTVFSVARRACFQIHLSPNLQSVYHLKPKSELTVEQLDTIDFDRIAVLDSACFVEFDTPETLLAGDGCSSRCTPGQINKRFKRIVASLFEII